MECYGYNIVLHVIIVVRAINDKPNLYDGNSIVQLWHVGTQVDTSKQQAHNYDQEHINRTYAKLLYEQVTLLCYAIVSQFI